MANQIHKVFPDWPKRTIFVGSSRNSDAESTSNGGLLYNHYKTFRGRLADAGMLNVSPDDPDLSDYLGGDNDTKFEGI